MKRVEIKMTPKQVATIDAQIVDKTVPFGLICQPVMHSKLLRVLILDEAEFNRFSRSFKRIVPKELLK